MKNTDPEDTIVAVSTPIGEGGIGIIRLSGADALKIADEIFVSRDNKRPSEFKTYTTHYGHAVLKINGQGQRKGKGQKVIDEVILTVMRAPKSYTKEDVVEINCHGGIQAVKKVLELTIKLGARIAEPGEFTRRAFLNGRIDLAQAEAVLDVIRSKTEGSLKVAVSQLEGDLSKKIDAIREDVIDIAAEIEASIDFPDEGLETADKTRLIKRVKDVLKRQRLMIGTYGEGMVLREGVLAIICGKPNVGKSSLMNLLLKRDRVIVSPIPGTTRDAVEEVINLKGLPIRLVDTAGIIETEDLLNKEGVKRSKKYLELADIILLMLDGSAKIGKADEDIIRLVKNKKKVVIINKTDLASRIDGKMIKKLFKNDRSVRISVEKKRNIASLENAIAKTVWKGGFSQGEGAIVSNARHKELLDKSLENMLSVNRALEEDLSPELIAVDLKEAIHNLGLIIGKSVSEDVLDRIFKRFCIGK